LNHKGINYAAATLRQVQRRLAQLERDVAQLKESVRCEQHAEAQKGKSTACNPNRSKQT
jgi:hypothetical protein